MSLRLVLAENIRVRREQSGYSQEKFAEVVNFNRNYTGIIERGEAAATIAIIDSIAQVLGVSVCILLGGSTLPKRKAGVKVLLSQNVKKYRMANGWSQDDFAKISGYHRTYVSVVERGKNLTVDTVEKLANALKVEPYKLFE